MLYEKTLRDEFAMAVLNGLIQDGKFPESAKPSQEQLKQFSVLAFQVADALMAQRDANSSAQELLARK
ncbi:MAG: hypothetical protein GY789_28210 [Hyphomicrobiales bacterium]|nr:hypothetical protein [Hyphomicrobiales bacterium]MCP5000165.1 hypothetical protein [Hyphomicrobiales bacterium]